MKATFSLSIPKPCSEDWNSFTPTATGGFCGSCQKNVIDFTKATDAEIIAFISQKPGRTCGRFRGDQMKTYTLTSPATIRPGYTLLKAGAISLLMLVMNKQAAAQTTSAKPTTEIVQQTKRTDKPTQTHTQTTVRGVVISDDDKQPVIAASIVQKGTTNGTITDADGNYELTISLSEGRVLVVSFIGMITLEVTLSEGRAITQNITLAPDITGFLGDIVLTGEAGVEAPYAEKRSGLTKFWEKVKGLFH
jgi:hypothetical protein